MGTFTMSYYPYATQLDGLMYDCVSACLWWYKHCAGTIQCVWWPLGAAGFLPQCETHCVCQSTGGEALTRFLRVMRGRGTTFRNCKRMAINALLEQMCEEEGVGFVGLWGYFVGKEDMYMRDGLHLSGKGAAVFSENLLRSMDNGTGCNFLN